MISYRNITEIKLNPSNPRVIKNDKFKKLVKAIKEFTKMMALRPIVIDENNIVFGGSGTTMIACHQINRKAYLVEFDTKYCDVIVSRYIKHRQSIGGDLLIKRNGKQLTDNEIIKYIENTNA